MSKIALERINSHEELCRIMQKLTHKKTHQIEDRIKRLEKIMIGCAGALITGMGYLIYILLSYISI